MLLIHMQLRVICRLAILLGCLFGPFQNLYAQPKTMPSKAEAARLVANERWAEALQILTDYQAQKPGDVAVLTQLGICYYQLHQPKEAHQYLDYVTTTGGSRDPEAYFYLARLLHSEGNYEDAIGRYKQFLRMTSETNPRRAMVKQQLRHCTTGMDITENSDVALVENMGSPVNSPADEFGPIPSVNFANRLYFSASRPDSKGGRRNAEGYEDVNAGRFCSDIYTAVFSNNGWGDVRGLSGLLNTARWEVALDFGANGQLLYFMRGFNSEQGTIYADTANRKDEYALESPLFEGPNRPEAGEVSLFFFNDTTLLFAADRPEGLGGYDLYISTLRGGVWQNPQNLGKSINSPYDETSPFLARDGRTLYFSSNHPLRSIGGYDVFKAVFDDKKLAWAPAASMGLPVNSPGDDLHFRLYADGQAACFSSDRLDGLGERDLYTAYFKEVQPEQQPRQPALFLSVTPIAAAEGGRDTLQVKPLFYDNDRNVLQAENIAQIEKIAEKAKLHPELNLIVTGFTDETGPAKFDLYYGIKRAEMVGKALQERGVAPERLVLRSAGAGFPLAKSVIGANANPLAPQLNRRIEVTFANNQQNELPFVMRTVRPILTEAMEAAGSARLDTAYGGVVYRVEMATTRQLFNNDALAIFDDLLIESTAGSGQYRYSTGLFRRLDEAVKTRQSLKEQGFTEATIVAMVQGLPVTKAAAVGLLRKYPDLATFIKY